MLDRDVLGHRGLEAGVFEDSGKGCPVMSGCWGSCLQPSLAAVDNAQDFELHSKHIGKSLKA